MSSRHPRVRSLPPILFRGLTSFRDLEARIADLPEELQRGDASEVFVEAYLWLTTVWQVADLWVVGQVPLDVRQALNLPADAKGIDGVFRTRSDVLVPYQVKHRIRPLASRVWTAASCPDPKGRRAVSFRSRSALPRLHD